MFSPGEKTSLISFLEAGKPVYVEGSDFGFFNNGDEFFDMFGAVWVRDGNPLGNISGLDGQIGSLAGGLELDYAHRVVIVDEYNDVIAAKSGELIFESQESAGRAVAYDAGTYKTIYTSSAFGGIIDGAGLNVKSELMARYLDFFFSEPDIDIELVPESAEIPQGGELVIDLSLVNNTDSPITFDVQADVYLPNGSPYTGNPVAGPATLTLGAGGSLTHRISHEIPGHAPLGDYTYTGTVEESGGGLLDTDSFAFTITAD